MRGAGADKAGDGGASGPPRAREVKRAVFIINIQSLESQVMAVLLDHFVAATAFEKREALRTDEEAALRSRVRDRAWQSGEEKIDGARR